MIEEIYLTKNELKDRTEGHKCLLESDDVQPICKLSRARNGLSIMLINPFFQSSTLNGTGLI